MEESAAAVIADLRHRVEMLEAERDILQNLHRYGPALDYGDEAAWVDCFTEDGVFEITGPQRHSVYEGQAALAGFAAQHTRAPECLHKHCVFDVQLAINGDRAQSVGYFTRLDQGPDGPVVHGFGRYHDHLVRGSDGRWRFRHRLVEIEVVRD